MGKALGFIICMILGVGILTLSLITDTLNCSENTCHMQSIIPQLNLLISQDSFKTEEIKYVSCVKTAQPSKSGNKFYYILKLGKEDGSEYNLGSFKKYQACKENLIPINNLCKGKTSNYTYISGSGVSNVMGFIFGILMLFIGFIILTEKPELSTDEGEDEEENPENTMNE